MKKLFRIIVLSALCIINGTNLQGQSFYAGAALRKITPDPLLPVSGGIGLPKAATEKKGDLFARALVLKKGNTSVAIVSVDNLGWPAVLGDKSRALIKDIPAENIIICATHTHSAPDSYAFPDEDGKTGADMNYLNWCAKMIAEAVNEASRNMEASFVKIAVGNASKGIAYNYYAPELYDPRCGVIQFIATEGQNKGKTIATLVNYAIHPEVIGSGRGILSPDLCGPLYDRIESKTGGMAMFINSAQGGMVTADTRREGGKEENTWEECKRIGELLGDEALRLVEKSQPVDNPGLFCASRTVKFPVETPAMKFILQNSPMKYTTSNDGFISTRINLVNLGSAQIITIPGEALPNIGFFLKRKMNADQPFIFGLANDAFGYILTRVDFNSFKRYDYISRTSLGENTGEILIDEELKLIKESPVPAIR